MRYKINAAESLKRFAEIGDLVEEDQKEDQGWERRVDRIEKELCEKGEW